MGGLKVFGGGGGKGLGGDGTVAPISDWWVVEEEDEGGSCKREI